MILCGAKVTAKHIHVRSKYKPLKCEGLTNCFCEDAVCKIMVVLEKQIRRDRKEWDLMLSH